MVDYYSVLGVPRDASNDDIKAAFRRMALKFHPDRHAGASQAEQQIASDQFKQAKEAYEVLGNERQRANYNREPGSGARYRTSSYGPSSTSSSYTGYAKTSSSSSYDWYRSTAYNNAYGNASSSSSTDWSSRTAYGSGGGQYGYAGGRRRTSAPEYHVRWGPWTVNPAEGPKIMLRVTVFGIAVCTLMFMDSISSAAWHRRNAGKTYEEMLDRLEHEKQLRAREKGNRGEPK